MNKLLAGTAVLLATVLVGSLPAAGQESAELTLVHAVPGVPVDVVVDGEILIEAFEPGTVQDVSALPGQTLGDLEVRAAGTEDVLIEPAEDFELPTSGSASVVVHLDASGTPTITLFENDTSALPGGTGRLTVRHAAAAPAVDVVAGDARPVQGLENGQSTDLELVAGEISGLQLAAAEGDPVADIPPLNLEAGTNLIVYAAGSLDEETLTFYTELRQLTMMPGGETGDGGMPADDGTDDAGVDADMDATPAPTAVNTGSPLSSSSRAPVLFAGALGLAAIAGGALVLRRRAAGTDHAS